MLDRPLVAAPGTLWNYNGGHTVLLAEILVQRSGRGLLDLARADLFEPLGIAKWEWRTGQHGQPLAYAGLRLAPPDLLRLGRLMLAGGAWQGRQVVPAAWVAATLQPAMTIGNGPLRYGRHWWAGQVQHGDRSLRWIGGFGNGGQRLQIVPELDLAVVLTAGAYNSVQIGPDELASVSQDRRLGLARRRRTAQQRGVVGVLGDRVVAGAADDLHRRHPRLEARQQQLGARARNDLVVLGGEQQCRRS